MSQSKIAEELGHLRVPISELSLDPRNARRHRDKSITAIKASLKRFGQKKPVVALFNGTVIAGNGVLEAAASLGWEELAVVRLPEGTSEADWKAYALADNRTAELSTWDTTALVEALKAVKELPEGLRFEQIAASAFTSGQAPKGAAGKLLPGMEGWEEKAPFQLMLTAEQFMRLKQGCQRGLRDGAGSTLEEQLVAMCTWWCGENGVQL